MKDLFNIAVAFLSIPFCLLCQAGSKPVPAKWLHDGRLVVPEFNFSINSPSPDPKWSYKDDSLGPVLVSGPLVAWIVGALEGAAVVGGVSAIGAGLIGIGIPKDSVVQYELAIKTRQVFADGAWHSSGRGKSEEYHREHTAHECDTALD
jgi:hypothetical protein